MIISGRDLRNKVRSELKNASVLLSDADYISPKRDWLKGKFYKAFWRNMQNDKVFRWREYHDCDNKAVDYWSFASKCHAHTMMIREKNGMDVVQGIAVGILFFTQDEGGGHAINFTLTNNKIEFIEPQNGQFIQLSQKEKDSSWFALF